MPIRCSAVNEAARRARRQLEAAIGDLRIARLNAGLSLSEVARALGVSRALVHAYEGGLIIPTPIRLAEWGAVVGLDVTVRAYQGASPLRDAGKLRILARFRALVGDAWRWRTEVPVSADPRERRAIDAVLERPVGRVGAEAVGRMVDTQGQVRPILLKQQASGVDRMILVLADTRHNRRALIDGRPTLEPAFPLAARQLLPTLRAGELPSANGVLLV